MQQHGSKYLPADPYPTTPPRPWGLSHLVKVHFFQTMVMLHIKLKIESQMQQHCSKYFARSHPRPWGWGQ